MSRFTVVVVGGGTAGSRVAAGLGSRVGTSVLLLESGPAVAPPGTETDDIFSALSIPSLQWPDTWVEHCPGRARVPYVRARTIGGGSAINGMVALRGEAADFDAWGLDGWSYADIAPSIDAVMADTRAAEPTAFDRAVGAALEGVGVPGWEPLAQSSRDGRRLASSRLLGRSSVTVRGGSTVRRIVIEAGVAVGVELTSGEFVEAGTVVCCAGAIGSPALLWRSGVELPGVGANVQDHPGVRILLRAREGHGITPGPVLRSVARWCSGIGTDRTDIAMLVMDHISPDGPVLRALSIGLMVPQSRGSIVEEDGSLVLRSMLLTDELDVRRLRSGVRTVLRSLDDAALRSMVEVLEAPGDSDDDIDRWMADTTADWYHATGTCRMGTPGDQGAVVDQMLCVQTIEGLHVVDASVLPTVTSCSTDVVVSALADRWVHTTHR